MRAARTPAPHFCAGAAVVSSCARERELSQIAAGGMTGEGWNNAKFAVFTAFRSVSQNVANAIIGKTLVLVFRDQRDWKRSRLLAKWHKKWHTAKAWLNFGSKLFRLSIH